ncbi:MAG: sigma-70 family RNA polymerase sigma factor [Polyangiales bacterium]
MAPPILARPALDTVDVYDQYADFVWATLGRLGVRDALLEDLSQEVFAVVHQRLSSYSGAGTLNAWLFGICVRVVIAHRRRAHTRREHTVDEMPEPTQPGPASVAAPSSPEELAAKSEARSVLASLLDEIDLERRAVFVMFEIEALSCDEIAETLGIPLGTVYSRLSAARKQFDQALSRYNARTRHGGRR